MHGICCQQMFGDHYRCHWPDERQILEIRSRPPLETRRKKHIDHIYQVHTIHARMSERLQFYQKALNVPVRDRHRIGWLIHFLYIFLQFKTRLATCAEIAYLVRIGRFNTFARAVRSRFYCTRIGTRVYFCKWVYCHFNRVTGGSWLSSLMRQRFRPIVCLFKAGSLIVLFLDWFLALGFLRSFFPDYFMIPSVWLFRHLWCCPDCDCESLCVSKSTNVGV